MNKTLSKYFLFLTLVFAWAGAKAQQCEWIDIFGGANNDYTTSHTVDDSNDVITTISYSATVVRGSYNFYASPGSNSALIKYAPDGTVKWISRIKCIDTTKFNIVTAGAITSYNNEYYIMGVTHGEIDFGNGVTIPTRLQSQLYVYIAKYNANGVAQWVKVIQQGAIISAYSTGGVMTMDHSGNILITLGTGGTWLFTSNDSLSTGHKNQLDIFLVKYTSNGSFVWAKRYGSNSLTKKEAPTTISTDASDNIYIGGGIDSLMPFGSQMIAGEGHVILKFDSAGNPIKGILLPYKFVNFNINGRVAAFPDGRVAFTGYLKDSMDFGNSIKLYAKGTSNQNAVFALFDKNFNCLWAKQEEPVNGNLELIGGINISEENIYSGGALSRQTILGGNLIGNAASTVYNFLIIKMDTIGSFLWAFAGETNGVVYTMGPDRQGNTYVGGGVRDSIDLFGVKEYGNGQQYDMFLAKLKDYEITRGNVYPGPYCAGDSISIPYTKDGRFAVGNEFIAELSDSAGNFDYGGRELGRVTDTLSGVIKGALPLFNVATNNRYRIRIVSTKPVVQSYYKKDTLRLLIYSKDSANAGPDLHICKGQSVRLGTTGGSRWLWSPPTYMPDLKDTSNRQPLIKPDSATEYRIIISDSSGCGDVDTDFVKVFIRPPLTTQIIGTSASCRGQKVQLRADISGGDSTGYWYKWTENGNPALLSTKDTITVSPHNTTTYKIIVGDSCNLKPDTLFFTLQIDTVLRVLASRDTTICKGAKAYLDAWGTGCDPSQYDFTWTVFGDNTVIGNSSHFEPSPTATTLYRVTLRDKSTSYFNARNVKVTVDNVFKATLTKDITLCKGQSVNLLAGAISCDTSQLRFAWNNGLDTLQSHTVSPATTTTYTVVVTNARNGLKDSAKVTVTVRPPLAVTLNPDTTICLGQTFQLRAVATGGNTAQHKLLWTANNSGWTDTNFVTTVTPSQNTTYTAILTDNCTAKPDTQKVKVTVLPPLKITLNPDTTICVGQTAQLRATPQGGNSTAYKIQWKEIGGAWASANTNETVAPTQSTTYRAIVTDGCTVTPDSAQITITVRLPLALSVSPDTLICVQGTAALRATPAGGFSPQYTIRWTDDNSSWSNTNFTVAVTPAQTTVYTAILSDNCTAKPDTQLVKVTLRPALSVSITAVDTVCENTPVLLSATVAGGKTANYSLLWTDNNSPWTSGQNPVQVVPQATTTYFANLTDNCSPAAKDTFTLIVLPTPKAMFDVSDTVGCMPVSVSFTDKSTGHDPAMNNWWFAGDVKASGTDTYRQSIAATGLYIFSLTVSNSLGCKDSSAQYKSVTVFKLPKADFSIKPDIKETGKELFLANNSSNVHRYIWDMGDGNGMVQLKLSDTVYTYTDSGNYAVTLVVVDDNGCTDTVVKQIRVFDALFCIMPNAFTPNGDNFNNVFAPVCNGSVNYTLTIYTRWGQVIQQCENCSWDGTFDGTPVPAGAYMYMLQVHAESRKKETIYGMVNLLR